MQTLTIIKTRKRTTIRALLLAAAFALGSGSAIAQIDVTSGLVGFYEFNGNSDDHSGHGHNAQLTRAVYGPDRFGNANSALDLRGTNNWAQIPHHDDFLIGTNDFTWAVWLKYGPQTNNGFGYSAVLIKASQAYSWPGPTMFVDLIPGKCTYRTDFPNQRDSTAAGLNDNTWRHFTLVRVGRSVKLYINGILDTSATTATLLNLSTTEPIWIGANQQKQASQNYDGLLDELRIYRRALSSVEVAEIFQRESSPRIELGKAVRPTFSNLVIGWRYQLQLSSDLTTWADYGAPFAATDSSMQYPAYWDLANWDSLFFRLQSL